MAAATRRIAALAAQLAGPAPPESPRLQTLPAAAAQTKPLRVLITGAAGQIAYSLVHLVASGQTLGPNQRIILHLLDIEPMVAKLKGLVMELEDCAYPLLVGIVATASEAEAFSGVDVAMLVGAMPRRPGMERKDLLLKNAEIFRAQGKALDKYASKNVKVVVVGNPANTNALIAQSNAPSIPKENFTALTRLDQNRAFAQVANRAGVPVTDVHDVHIWGNHSATQYPDLDHGYLDNYPQPGARTPIPKVITDVNWVRNTFIPVVQQRGAAVLAARQASSAMSAAKAVSDHVHDWLLGHPNNEIVSMGVYSDGSYGIPKGLIFSFPVRTHNGTWSIVQGLELSDFAREMLAKTTKELQEEKAMAGL